MLKNTQKEQDALAEEKSLQLADVMGFTLQEHHLERIDHHMAMLKYYMNEQKETYDANRI